MYNIAEFIDIHYCFCLFQFNDLLLVCSEQIMGSYKLRARLNVEGMEVLPGENMNISNTFCVKCIEKNVEFLDE